MKKCNIATLQAFAIAKGGLLLSTKYVNNKQDYLWKCKEDHEWLARWAEFQPDFLLAIKDGKTKLACLSESVNLSQLIYEVDCYLDILKDLRWAEIQRQSKKK